MQFDLSHFRSIRVSDQEDLEERRSRPIGAGGETGREASVDIRKSRARNIVKQVSSY